MHKKKRFFLYSCIFLLFLSTSVYSASTYKENVTTIQLIGLNDFHGQLDTYQEVSGQKVGGAEYVASLVKKLRNQNPDSLLVHAGDMVGGSPPLSSVFQDEPTIEFLNSLHVDIGTLGNHEFDRGVPEMLRLIQSDPSSDFRGSTTTYISANVLNKDTHSPLFPPYLVKEINGKKIGFIGVVTTETQDYVVPSHLNGLIITDEVEAINHAATEIVSQGVTTIVVLAHVSAKSSLTGGNPRQELVKMAPSLHNEIDVIFAGHSHEYANTIVDNKLIVQGYSYGKAITQVNLEFDNTTDTLLNKEATIHLTSHEHIEPDLQTIQLLEKYRVKQNEMNQIVMILPQSISRKKDRNGDSPLGKLLVESMSNETQADIAFTHHGGIRFNLEKGPISINDVKRALPFNHHVLKVELSGLQIKQAIEEQWKGEKENLLQIKGLTYMNTSPFSKKVETIYLDNGEKLKLNSTYTVALTDYLGNGGDGFLAFQNHRLLKKYGNVSDLLIDYLREENY
ncbi:bifunctional metallophosphatase/5'-nucleotidase [Bacillus weihaiensis]|uniref:bifunctional metallophosphatase/5'-nucleotidase n=1 Tax=Bacillus weihaiensis TaxID=1547283 RepID=UPI0023529571|nr:bifunctional metallophosphatase/5'-nucleotidase [Bacillus weihaiensis]